MVNATNGFALLLFGIFIWLGRWIGIQALLDVNPHVLTGIAIVTVFGLATVIVSILRRIANSPG